MCAGAGELLGPGGGRPRPHPLDAVPAVSPRHGPGIRQLHAGAGAGGGLGPIRRHQGGGPGQDRPQHGGTAGGHRQDRRRADGHLRHGRGNK